MARGRDCAVDPCDRYASQAAPQPARLVGRRLRGQLDAHVSSTCWRLPLLRAGAAGLAGEHARRPSGKTWLETLATCRHQRRDHTAQSALGLRIEGRPAVNAIRRPFATSLFEVQDEGSQLLARWSMRERGEMVVDFCAGAGGKTLALGAAMRKHRPPLCVRHLGPPAAALKPRLARSGLSNVHPVQIAHERDERIKRLAGKIDRVLVDAPCFGPGHAAHAIRTSNGGRRRPAVGTAASSSSKPSWPAPPRCVKPGGRLVYGHVQPARS